MQTELKRTTGWIILETLSNYGIDAVFGIPGTHNLEFYRPLTHFGIRAVTTRHEQGAGYGADGWSLQTGKPGVVLTTSGPGLLNALSAAGTAYCESRPMIILSPGPARGKEFADVGTLHETKDQLAAASAIVEWGRRVQTVDEAVQAVHDAFELFATTRPRPVYIEVPLDLLEEESDIGATKLQAKKFPAPGIADAAQVTAAADLLRDAKNPVILAGVDPAARVKNWCSSLKNWEHRLLPRRTRRVLLTRTTHCHWAQTCAWGRPATLPVTQMFCSLSVQSLVMLNSGLISSMPPAK